jgi:hypothetical protein
MIALLSMTNPLWDFVIGPLALVGFGWWLRGRSRDADPLGPYDLTEEDYR